MFYTLHYKKLAFRRGSLGLNPGQSKWRLSLARSQWDRFLCEHFGCTLWHSNRPNTEHPSSLSCCCCQENWTKPANFIKNQCSLEGAGRGGGYVFHAANVTMRDNFVSFFVWGLRNFCFNTFSYLLRPWTFFRNNMPWIHQLMQG
jgi:hypothetical protein